MNRNYRFPSLLVFILTLLLLQACDGMTVTPDPIQAGMVLASPAQSDLYCEACAQATLAVAMTQDRKNADALAAATAEIERANAQSTLNSANATLSAALTQEQENSNILAARIAATSQIERANAQATLNSAGSTQIAAMTQDQYDLQLAQAAGTQTAMAIMTLQKESDLAASTQTAIADGIATQAQAAVATSQWYDDQARKRDEERQAPIAFLWMWCFPVFLVLFAGLILWGLWRWIRPGKPVPPMLDKPEPLHQHDNSLPRIETDIVDDPYQLMEPDDRVDEWMEEVKRKLHASDNEDEHDNSAL
jgi:hypothetical protein